MSITIGKARNPNTPVAVLRELAKDSDEFIRYEVAMNTNTPPEVLKELAKDKHRYVRVEVAINPNTPPEVLVELAKDEDKYVRYWVAKNPGTPTSRRSVMPKFKPGDRVAFSPNQPPYKHLARVYGDYSFIIDTVYYTIGTGVCELLYPDRSKVVYPGTNAPASIALSSICKV